MKTPLACALTFAMCCGVYVALAGPLDPPLGPVVSTYKTLDDVEPRIPVSTATTPGDTLSVFRIDEPGSYYMTSPIRARDGMNGITIAASGVTIDLGGYEHSGVVVGGTSRAAVVATAGASDLMIRNGTVSGWDGRGVDFSFSDRVRFERVSAHKNGSGGFRAGDDASFIDCSATENERAGMVAGDGSVMTRCRARGNRSEGMSLGDDSVITECIASLNDTTGILVTDGIVSRCTANENGVDGITIFDGIVESCVTNHNGSDGISTASVGGAGVIRNAIIRDNYCEGNGTVSGDGAGIAVLSRSCVIEDNLLIGNDFGVRVPINDSGVMVVRNKAFENGVNFLIAGGNPTGPIVNVTGQTNLAGVPNADHPLANFQRTMFPFQ